MNRILIACAFALTGCATTVEPPDMPLTPGAEAVELRDAQAIKTHPIDTAQCVALGQRSIGPVTYNNIVVAQKNETFAAGGNLFYATWFAPVSAYSTTQTVTGMVYRCHREGDTSKHR